MKVIKRRLAVILSLMMILSAFEVLGVFAGDGDPVVKDLKVLASWQSVHLRWTAENADGVTYTIKVDGKDWTKVSKVSDTEYRVYGLNDRVNCLTGKYPTYSFTVVAKKGGEEIDTLTGSGAPVRTISYKLKIKKSGTLKSHGGPKASMKVKKGQYIYAYGFGGGKYIFKNANGSVFYCNKSRTGKRSCVYSKSWNYSDEEAALFVNDCGSCDSSTKALVWVNTYTQHMYLFKKDGGKWVLDVVSAECSTGKASSPSPTGVSGKKAVQKKIKKRHGIPFWTCYSSINAIHAKKSSWKMSKPASNGCVRNLKPNAQRVYNNAGKKSRVFLY